MDRITPVLVIAYRLLRLLVACTLPLSACVASEPDATEAAEREISAPTTSFDLPVWKQLVIPNLFGVPGDENLTVPVYRSEGRRGPAILLVHGNSSSSRSYVRQVPPRRRSCLQFDHLLASFIADVAR